MVIVALNHANPGDAIYGPTMQSLKMALSMLDLGGCGENEVQS